MDISVIIPVYNKAEYIQQCIESLQEQDFDEFEIVAVDDGSTDKSGEICDRIVNQYPNFRVFHTPNQGVTAARRYGLEQAKGTYVVFVDSDDALMPHALKTLYETIEKQKADEVIGTFCTQDGVNSPVVYEGLTPVEPLVQQIITGKNRFPVLWAIIFRKEILEGCLDTPRDIIEGEDKLMQVKVLMKTPKVFFISEQVYRYTLGLPNNRRHTLEREMLYDNILRQTLQPHWSDYEAAFTLHQLKEYEKFIHDGQYEVRQAYYDAQLSSIKHPLPLYDRIVWMLPASISRPLIKFYRWAIQIKLHHL